MVEYVKALISMFGNDEETEGQGLVEYALIIVLISVAAFATMQALSVGINGVFTDITGKL